MIAEMSWVNASWLAICSCVITLIVAGTVLTGALLRVADTLICSISSAKALWLNSNKLNDNGDKRRAAEPDIISPAKDDDE